MSGRGRSLSIGASRKRTGSTSPGKKTEKPKRPRQTLNSKMAANGVNPNTGEKDDTNEEMSSPTSSTPERPLSLLASEAIDLSTPVKIVGSNPPSLEDIMGGIKVIMKEQEDRMQSSIAKSLASQSAAQKENEEQMQRSIQQSLKDHSAVVSESVTSLETRVDQKLSGYDAAMGKITSDATILTQSVATLQVTSQQTKMTLKKN